MHRTHHTFSLLQAVAVLAIFAITLWSIGWPAIRTAEAANVISFSDTLSDSSGTSTANHTIEFTTPSGMAAGETITLTFETGFTGINSLTPADLDLEIDGVDQDLHDSAAGPVWDVAPAGQSIDITSGTDTIGPNATVTIEIGTNATFASSSANQISNPTTPGSYTIDVTVGSGGDTGTTRVAITDQVTVTASVDTTFDFTVSGVTQSQTVNGDTTTGPTTATEIPFGTLEDGTASTAAQDLEVSTNAANGFVVTVQTDQQLTSANGADIDGFSDGSYVETPVIWSAPSATVSNENTYGHWGLTSEDDTLTETLAADPFGAQLYASASTTPVEVFRHDGPTDGSTPGAGSTRVGYRVEITALQEAADDYTATLTYVATPVF